MDEAEIRGAANRDSGGKTLQWGRLMDEAEIVCIHDGTKLGCTLQWGRLMDEAEIAALATGGGTTAYRAVFERCSLSGMQRGLARYVFPLQVLTCQ